MATNLWEIQKTMSGGFWDVNQVVDALSGNNDVGQIKAFSPIAVPSAPTVAVNTTSGNLTGNYQYAVAFLTGYLQGDPQNPGSGTLHTQGNTGGGTASAVVSPNGQQVNLTNIPIGGTGVVARVLYRTKSGGNSYFFLQQINDNTTTSWTDNVVDASLGSAMPVTNTTGTKFVGDGSLLTNLPTQTIPSASSTTAGIVKTTGTSGVAVTTDGGTMTGPINSTNTSGTDSAFGSTNYSAALGASWFSKNLGGDQYQINGTQEATDRIVASTSSGSVLTNFIRQWWSYAKNLAVFSVDFITGVVRTLNNTLDDGSGNSVAAGSVTGTALIPSGLAGATTPTRIVGGTNGSAPTTGTWNVGDEATDVTGAKWICTVAGTPGTWVISGVHGYEFDVALIFSGNAILSGTATTPAFQGNRFSTKINNVSSRVTCFYDVVLSSNDNTGATTAYSQLYDITSSAVVANSQISTTTNSGNTGFGPTRSSAIALTAGHQYGIQIWTSNSANGAVIYTARIVGQI